MTDPVDKYELEHQKQKRVEQNRICDCPICIWNGRCKLTPYTNLCRRFQKTVRKT
jgi:hypothetical protein